MSTIRIRRRDLFELALGYALVLLGVWTPQPITRYFFWLGLLWVLLVTILSGDDLRTLGLSPRRLHRSWYIILITCGGAMIALFVAHVIGTLHIAFSSTTPRWHAFAYLLWAFIQQFILQDYFLLRLLRIMPTERSAVVIATTLFALAHLPNPLLTVVTALWGFASCYLFLRYRDLYSLGIAHAVLGLCIAFTIPNPVHHNMRVGLGYIKYHHHK